MKVPYICELKYKHLIFEEIATPIVIGNRNCILFVLCNWSMAMTRLKPLLDSLITFEKVTVLLIDIDNDKVFMPFIKMNSLPLDIWGGWGEILWIKNGKVSDVMTKNFDINSLSKYNSKIFRE